MDLFGDTSLLSETPHTKDGKEIRLGALVEYVGELASQYAYTDGRAMARVDRIEGNQITITMYKDNKPYKLRVPASDLHS